MPARAAPKINPKIIEVTAIDYIVNTAPLIRRLLRDERSSNPRTNSR
jgi:hypothetical protein